MDGQMTIWDIFEPDTGNPLDEIPEGEMVQRIGLALGLTFKWNNHLEQWVAKCGYGITADLEYSTWNTDDERQGKRFIGCGVNTSTSGCGSGQDTIPEAITYIGSAIQRYKEEIWRAKNDREK